MAFDEFLRWLGHEELAARSDGERVAEDLGKVVRQIIHRAGRLEGMHALDVGCGAGAVAFAATDTGASVTAIDLDHTALAKARTLVARSAARVRIVAADGRHLPFLDEAFDVSLHRSVLVYLSDAAGVAREERRVLRAGGRVSCSESLGSAIELETSEPGIRRVWDGLRSIMTEAAPMSFSFSHENLSDLYEGAGFEDVEVERVDRHVGLDSGESVARVFQTRPGAGLSAREYWERAGVPSEFLNEFFARLVLEADEGRPARLLTPEGFLTARAPQ
ncbi:MAG: class I SAM-dependent methyltransferase [Actinomycetota bacterium]